MAIGTYPTSLAPEGGLLWRETFCSAICGHLKENNQRGNAYSMWTCRWEQNNLPPFWCLFFLNRIITGKKKGVTPQQRMKKTMAFTPQEVNTTPTPSVKALLGGERTLSSITSYYVERGMTIIGDVSCQQLDCKWTITPVLVNRKGVILQHMNKRSV